jgi:hypothetical protein
MAEDGAASCQRRSARQGNPWTEIAIKFSNTLDAGRTLPPGLVAQLSRSELRDLIRYLLDLGKKGE